MMRVSRLGAVAFLSACLMSAPRVRASAEDAGASVEARNVVEAYFRALNESKLETVVGLYHKDSVFLPNDAPAARGIDEIAKAYRTLFQTAKLSTEHVYLHVSARGELAVVESQGRGTLTLLESKKVRPSNNKELFVLRKIDGQWKIDRYMFNGSERQGP